MEEWVLVNLVGRNARKAVAGDAEEVEVCEEGERVGRCQAVVV